MTSIQFDLKFRRRRSSVVLIWCSTCVVGSGDQTRPLLFFYLSSVCLFVRMSSPHWGLPSTGPSREHQVPNSGPNKKKTLSLSYYTYPSEFDKYIDYSKMICCPHSTVGYLFPAFLNWPKSRWIVCPHLWEKTASSWFGLLTLIWVVFVFWLRPHRVFCTSWFWIGLWKHPNC